LFGEQLPALAKREGLRLAEIESMKQGERCAEPIGIEKESKQ